MNRPLVVAISGASGAVYGVRLLEMLSLAGREVHLTVSPTGRLVLERELGIDKDQLDARLTGETPLAADWLFDGLNAFGRTVAVGDAMARPAPIHYHDPDDFLAPIASGSFLTSGMAVCPCSSATLSAVVHAAGSNLLFRAADVHLKERRPLVLVHRETPVSAAQLDNMRRAAELGAVVLPAAPGWYHGVRSPIDLVDFIVGRVLDQLGVEHELTRRWNAGETNV